MMGSHGAMGTSNVPVSSGAFKTREPQGRNGQDGRGGREAIEKVRLATRVEGFERYEDPGRLTEFVENTAGHAPEAERFDKDFAIVEAHTREMQRQRHGAIIDARRQERMDREEERWQIAEEQKRMEAERQRALQDTDKAKANRSSLPYDPITLMYDDGNDGERLKYYDDKTKYRAGLRAANMQKHDMSTAYNPITGLPQQRLDVPGRPKSPSFIH